MHDDNFACLSALRATLSSLVSQGAYYIPPSKRSTRRDFLSKPEPVTRACGSLHAGPSPGPKSPPAVPHRPQMPLDGRGTNLRSLSISTHCENTMVASGALRITWPLRTLTILQPTAGRPRARRTPRMPSCLRVEARGLSFSKSCLLGSATTWYLDRIAEPTHSLAREQ